MGTIAPELKTKIEVLTIEQLEDMGEALLDFATIADYLETWLAYNAPEAVEGTSQKGSDYN
ncbi:MAG: DUF4351 domain-containing protein [Prochlorotrichaceae cyanobacterium]